MNTKTFDWGPPQRTYLEEPMRLGEILDQIFDPTRRVNQTTNLNTVQHSSPWHRPTGGSVTRPQRPGRTFPHPTPAEAPE